MAIVISGNGIDMGNNPVSNVAINNNVDVVDKEYVDNRSALPIGAILNGYTIFDNCIVAFGGEFNRADYPKLWAYLQANPTLVKTEAQWQSEATANGGICGFFSDGNGTTTFRVPSLDGTFVRFSSRAVGSYQADEFKSHTHGVPQGGDYTASGARSSFDNGASIDTYVQTQARGGEETRPKNIAILPLIVAK